MIASTKRELVLGIDFGSSSTIAGVLIGNQIQLVQEQGDPVMPSVVYVPSRGAPEIGHRAAQRQLVEPQRVLRSIKRVLGVSADSEVVRRYTASVSHPVERAGDAVVLKLGGDKIAVEQAVGWILARVRELAETRFGGKAERAVLTVSATAPSGYLDAIRRAAKLAHLEVVALIAEPVAGALALDLHTQAANRNIVVCDFGGGTFDVSAVVQRGLAFTPIATAGDCYLGGDDLDEALAEGVASVIFRSSRYDMHRDAVRWNELRVRCESAKRQLSSHSQVPLVMRNAYIEQGKSKDLQLVLDPTWAESVWRGLLERVDGVVDDLLVRAGWAANAVDLVALIGGSSHVPAFRRAMTARFGRSKIVQPPHAELAVAQGATLLTARYRRQAESTTDRIPILVDA
jgi:molecular chaperone DnaK (HSP70)